MFRPELVLIELFEIFDAQDVALHQSFNRSISSFVASPGSQTSLLQFKSTWCIASLPRDSGDTMQSGSLHLSSQIADVPCLGIAA